VCTRARVKTLHLFFPQSRFDALTRSTTGGKTSVDLVLLNSDGIQIARFLDLTSLGGDGTAMSSEHADET
jgi:hypothetical protein